MNYFILLLINMLHTIFAKEDLIQVITIQIEQHPNCRNQQTKSWQSVYYNQQILLQLDTNAHLLKISHSMLNL